MFEFINISKKFKLDLMKGGGEFFALNDLSFKVGANTLTGFLGANGAGKTTSLKILFQFIPTTSGEVRFDQSLGHHWGEIRSKIGYVPERPYFYPHLTGRELVHFTGQLNDIRNNDIKSKISEWAERLGIDHALDRKLSGYSKGMLQRIGVLSSLVHNPELIIFDEPLSGLDPLGRAEIKRTFTDLQKLGKTIFFSSHIVSDVEEVCDEVVVIDKGSLIYSGNIESILDKNSNDNYEVYCSGKTESLCQKNETLVKRQTNQGVYFEVPSDQLNRLIQEILTTESKLERVIKQRVTLEEYVYSTSKENEVNIK